MFSQKSLRPCVWTKEVTALEGLKKNKQLNLFIAYMNIRIHIRFSDH